MNSVSSLMNLKWSDLLTPFSYVKRKVDLAIGSIKTFIFNPGFVSRPAGDPLIAQDLSGIELLCITKKLLKHHRNDSLFKIDHRRNYDEAIFTCGPEDSKKYRAIYQKLFGANGRKDVQKIIEQVLKNFLKDQGENKASVHSDEFEEELVNEISWLIIFGNLAKDKFPDDLRRSLMYKPSSEELTKTLDEAFGNDVPVWNMMAGSFNSFEKCSNLAVLIDGFENAKLGLKRTINECISNPKFCALIHKELEEHMSTGDLPLEDAVHKCEILDRVCLEALRRFPVIKNIKRTVARDFNVDECKDANLPLATLKAGKQLYISIQDLARNEAIVGERPERFCPMRKLFDKDTKGFWPENLILFGYGAHQCPAWWAYKEIVTQVIGHLCYHRVLA